MGAVKPMVRLPSTNSRIWSNVSRSMFCMMMFIHPQHDTFLRLSRSGSPRIGNNLPLRARPALETNHPFRLIPHWIILRLANDYGMCHVEWYDPENGQSRPRDSAETCP